MFWAPSSAVLVTNFALQWLCWCRWSYPCLY